MNKSLVLILLFMLNHQFVFTEKPIDYIIEINDSIIKTDNGKGGKFIFYVLPEITLFKKDKSEKKDKNKLVASLLALTLGPFGVHRLYLGTKPMVPIAYTLTLGGGFFILPLIDIFYIILAENPEDIENNNHVFIWNKKKASE